MSCVLLVAYTVFTEVHDISRFEFTYKLPKNLELNSNSMRIIWRCFRQVHTDLSLHCEDFHNFEHQF